MNDKNEKGAIIETYTAIFLNSYLHAWDKVRSVFADVVQIDYSSLNGQPPEQLKSDDLVAAWSALLPKFNFTLHYLTNHVVSVQGARANASCYGHAMHHLKGVEEGDFWEVYGTYEFVLKKTDSWRVTSMRYNHKYAAGNLNLPVIAARS